MVSDSNNLDEAEKRWADTLDSPPDGRRSAKHVFSDLTDDQVREIRAAVPVYGKNTLRRLAREMGLDKSLIYRIRAGTSYRHVK